MGSCAVGWLVVGSIVKSTGIDLYYRNRNGTRPGRGEFSDTLTRLVHKCWSEMSRKPGAPRYHKYKSGTYWIASLPLVGTYRVEHRLDGGCELYRLSPVVAPVSPVQTSEAEPRL